MAIALGVQFTLSEHFHPDNGLKEGWYQRDKSKGPDFFLEQVGCTAIIIVPDFIHRKAKVEGKRGVTCEAIAKRLIDILLVEEFGGG